MKVKIYTIQQKAIPVVVEEEADRKYVKIKWQGEDYLREIISESINAPSVLVILPDLFTYYYIKNTYWLPRNIQLAYMDGKPTTIIEEKRINYQF